MSTTSNVPPDPSLATAETASTPRWIMLAFLAAFALVGYLLYANHEERQAREAAAVQAAEADKAIAASLDKTNSRLADLKGQLEVTTQKLGLTQDETARARALAQAIRKDQKSSDEQLRSQIGQVQQETSTKLGAVSTDLSGTKSDVEATKKDLEAIKNRLERTVGDLGVASGLIARNQEEVEALKRLGERNIFEFNISRSKSMQRVGPIQLQLRKTDQKHFRYTVNVVADDKTIEKKDKTVGEPVQFYVKGARTPFEIVVFDLGKDTATGYLSTPKEGAAAATAPSK